MNIPVAFPPVPTSRYPRKFRQLRLPAPYDFAASQVTWLSALPTGGDHAMHKCLCVGRPLALSRLVGSSGLEPPTSRLSGGCSNQLSYKPMCRSFPHGSITLWKSFEDPSRILIGFLVEMMGFEPMTPCLQGRCSPS